VTTATLWALVVAFTSVGPTTLEGSTVIRGYASKAHCEAALLALISASASETFIIERDGCQPYQGD
jgi:hypothetical protein